MDMISSRENTERAAAIVVGEGSTLTRGLCPEWMIAIAQGDTSTRGNCSPFHVIVPDVGYRGRAAVWCGCGSPVERHEANLIRWGRAWERDSRMQFSSVVLRAVR